MQQLKENFEMVNNGIMTLVMHIKIFFSSCSEETLGGKKKQQVNKHEYSYTHSCSSSKNFIQRQHFILLQNRNIFFYIHHLYSSCIPQFKATHVLVPSHFMI